MCFVHVQEYFDFIEKEQRKDFELMMRKYQAIGPLLTKVEGLVVNTNTGQSRKLQQYYAHWETKIFNALTAVC
jgi:dynein heavy chain